MTEEQITLLFEKLDRIIELMESGDEGPEWMDQLIEVVQAQTEAGKEQIEIRKAYASHYECDQLAELGIWDTENCCPECHMGLYPPRPINTPFGSFNVCHKIIEAGRKESIEAGNIPHEEPM